MICVLILVEVEINIGKSPTNLQITIDFYNLYSNFIQRTEYYISIIIRPRGDDDVSKHMNEKGTDDGKITDARLQREAEEKKAQSRRYPDENEKQWT